MARSTDIFLCYDLGGTKLLCALVNAQGRVLRSATRLIDQELGFKGLVQDFADLAKEINATKFKRVSIASAGPLHPEKGVLLDPTNFFTGQKTWGVIPLARDLKRIFKKEVLLENDAAAAALAEAWRGGHGKAKNILTVTLGTGVGVGAVTSGLLARAGRGLHPESSHIALNAGDRTRPCGCGAFGCIEAYLGGSHFARRLSSQLGRDLTGEQCHRLALEGEAHALKAYGDYGQHLAQAIRAWALLYAPEVVVLAGGFAHSHPHFLPAAKAALPQQLARYRAGINLLPKIKISKLGGFAGVIGAAYVALIRK